MGPVQVTPESQMDMAVNRVLSTRDSARVPGKAINKRLGNLKMGALWTAHLDFLS